MKTKVYLAKSNRSNPTHVSRVRAELEKYDVEIVEYTGGKYSNKPLLKCDYLVVIPDLSGYDFNYHLKNENEYWYEEDDICLGKGLYNQISEFTEKQGDDKSVMIIKYVDDVDIFYSYVKDTNLNDVDDYINYGMLTFQDCTIDFINEMLDDNFTLKKYNNMEPKESKWSWDHDIDVATNAIVEGLKKLQNKRIDDEVNARGFNKRRLLLAV